MGLDSYFGRKIIKDGKETLGMASDLVFPEVHLCGGILSGGNGSFRGKVYNEFIEKISGETLYVEWNLDIEKVAKSLREYVDSHKDTDPDEIVDIDWGTSFHEVVDLCTLFEFAVDNDLAYVGWW